MAQCWTYIKAAMLLNSAQNGTAGAYASSPKTFKALTLSPVQIHVHTQLLEDEKLSQLPRLLRADELRLARCHLCN
jgi:hypothetical protein